MTANDKPKTLTTEEKITEYARCANGLKGFWYFLTKYIFTLDNETGQVKRFPAWTYFEVVIKALFAGKNVARKKSRRLILSWFFMAYELWLISFKDTYPIFNLSYKENLVDDGTPNSLHGKIKFMYDRLPVFLQMGLEFKHCRIECKATGSYIVGESSSEDAGRGGGFRFGFIDEAAFLRHAEVIFAAFIRACEQVAMVSTSNGKSTMFYRVCNVVARDNPLWDYEFMHASIRPDRDQAYFDRCKREMTPLQYAREIDGDDEASVAGRVWPMFSTGQNGHVVVGLFQKNIIPDLTFDFGAVPTSIKFIQKVMDEGRIVNEIEAHYKTPEQITSMIVDKYVEMGFLKSYKDSEMQTGEYKEYVKQFLKTIKAYGDPAGHARLQDGSPSLIRQYENLGIIINTKKQSNVELGITEVTRRLTYRKMFVADTCIMTIDELGGCHYKVDERTGEIKDGTKYAHDRLSHGADAIRYWCENNPLQTEASDIETPTGKQHKPVSRFSSNLKKARLKHAGRGRKSSGTGTNYKRG